MKLSPLVGSALLLLSLAATATGAIAAGPTVPEPEVTLRPADFSQGAYDLALTIGLPEGWHTYWRNPGDVGVPPLISTEGSENVGALKVAFPAPVRHFDGYAESIVYEGGVTLPLRLTPGEPGEPVHLKLSLLFGYCLDICVPGQADFDLTLAPDMATDAAVESVLTDARSHVPMPEGEGAPAQLVSFDPHGESNGKPVYRLVVETAKPADGKVDVFAEGPEGWSLPLPRPVAVDGDEGNRHVFDLTIDGLPRKADPHGADLRFTIVAGDKAVEAVRKLP
ncbi:putative protein predicted to be involved in C-type cytochrome biogenesis [Hartmannibacter diazotrophicus]|uniref:Thiol:disulfide interchange protein DsbD N-terminal domain-containing protein n=1 Tax=Hartmannibacter diazotrophicus TaxID=1482074 RepID=A0A2C9D329_9HYPH|nr:protein-disulfide reductase DsbD domain-containing protein [Hartmannibacter diazotrophicus]SON54670.1 putative protein predicted to be involved in C-type cytochrome biogenesis [Hartmannibacter diazotrophicus]